MNMSRYLYAFLTASIILVSCNSAQNGDSAEGESNKKDDFKWQTEQFADLKIIRYQIPGFDQLTLDQKKLVYYLTEAGLSGRDIMWDMNYRHNLKIRSSLEHIVKNYKGDMDSDDWNSFMEYTKRIWFSSGIHHHYSNDKFEPGFSEEYFRGLMDETGAELSDYIIAVIFDPEIDNKKVNQNPDKDLVLASAINFYAPDITQAEVEAFYGARIDKNNEKPISHGLNSRLIRNADGEIEEDVYKIGGLYSESLEKVVYWLEKATGVAENEAQKNALNLLIEYYKSGSLQTWDDYNVAWVEATEGDIDYINGFIEVYNDPMGYRGSYETIVEIKDFDASARMKVISDEAQWFENNSSIQDEHKKEAVVGITYKVVTVAGEAGDASPSTPVGVNLPNANWIRAKHGSKSVSLGNIRTAYEGAAGKGFLKEYCYTEDEIKRSEDHGQLASKIHTALHEVIGHASGKLNPGVGTPKETLKNYSSPLEEARADLVSLYYMMDEKMVELGVMESLETGKTQYEGYIRNGCMTQLRRLKIGDKVEQAHMRNRQMVSMWAYEHGKADNVIEKTVKDGKTYFVVNDYEKLRELFGQLLREIQRIKSEGDYAAGMALIEDYGVQVDPDLHQEVLDRAEKLNSAPYGGFINPKLVPVTENGQITDIVIEYPDDFTGQMLEYGEKYNFLPIEQPMGKIKG